MAISDFLAVYDAQVFYNILLAMMLEFNIVLGSHTVNNMLCTIACILET